jgi:hypothetical protein
MSDLLTTLVQVGSLTGAAFTVGTTIAARTLPWLRTKATGRMVTRHLGSIYTKEDVEEAVRYYVEPMCQNSDPARGDEPHLALAKEKLFAAFDRALNNPQDYRYFLLLADSGMGKSSALINYYARHIRRLRRRFEISIVPLGIHDADARIEAIPEKQKTVLFLDAFDEDIQAIVDPPERLRILLEATRGFRTVFITCRSQFFNREADIPKRTGVLRVGVRSAGKSAEYPFHRIYLSPFSDVEIKLYFEKRYPLWKYKVRQRASYIMSRAPSLAARPMLLTHIDDLVESEQQVRCSAELYEEMVEAWLLREESVVQSRGHLCEFSELLAVDLFMNREKRGSERISVSEIESLARAWNIPLESWVLTGRSLLNRDVEGNYKFSHRSILEFLFVRRVAGGSFTPPINLRWTDQMKRFLEEALTFKLSWLGPDLRGLHELVAGKGHLPGNFIETLLTISDTVTAFGYVAQRGHPEMVVFKEGTVFSIKRDASLKEVAEEVLIAMRWERCRHLIAGSSDPKCVVVNTRGQVLVLICSRVEDTLEVLRLIRPLLSGFAIAGVP